MSGGLTRRTQENLVCAVLLVVFGVLLLICGGVGFVAATTGDALGA